jgi:hypothetical protein
MATDQPPAPLPPGTPPAPGTPNPHRRRDFLIGLGLGLIPGVLAIMGISGSVQSTMLLLNSVSGYLLIAGIALYVATLIAMIVLVSIRRTRTIGAGMLVAWVTQPVFVFISCVVIISQPRH